MARIEIRSTSDNLSTIRSRANLRASSLFPFILLTAESPDLTVEIYLTPLELLAILDDQDLELHTKHPPTNHPKVIT